MQLVYFVTATSATKGTTYEPAVHKPEHADVGRPVVLPYNPAAQSVHVDAPAKLYFPVGHIVGDATVDPAAHVNPECGHTRMHAVLLST